jgi:hypothetical protein
MIILFQRKLKQNKTNCDMYYILLYKVQSDLEQHYLDFSNKVRILFVQKIRKSVC